MVFTSGLGVDGVDVLMGGPFCAPTSCKWREKNSTQKGLTKLFIRSYFSGGYVDRPGWLTSHYSYNST